MTPKLSIICITYNQATFIRQTLESFLMQKTNFPFEILVHDDASIDGTTEIIKEFEDKYPHIIKAVYQKENQFSKGTNITKNFLYPLVRGKYVALCEGDDYWTDENKLQRQVDFMETHPDYTLCFHPVTVHYEDNSQADHLFPLPDQITSRKLTFAKLLEQNFIQTNSVLYRWRFHHDSLNLLRERILPCDWFIHLLHAQVGKIAFFPEPMAVYRKWQGGIWNGAGKSPEWFNRCGLANLRFWLAMEETFHINTRSEFEKLFFQILKYGNDTTLQNLKSEFADDYTKLEPQTRQKTLNTIKYVGEKFMHYFVFGSARKKLKKRCQIAKFLSRF